MRKTRLLLFSFFIFSIFLVTTTYATEDQFSKNYLRLGYKEVDKALDESEKHFNREIALPSKVPPITFTHSFGILSNLEGEGNDHLVIEYLDEGSGNNHYMILVRPIDYKLPLREKMVDETLKLNDGTNAIYSTTMATGFNSLVFEKNELQYILCLDQDASNKALELLLDVANSIES